ncbi:hypothetical protein MMC10_010615 [Thelotrema lepadinum]|nr:hypothetical protein [Thelotrema lepadinum]
MDGDHADQQGTMDFGSDVLHGRKAIEHYEALEPSQKYYHLSRILCPPANASSPSLIGKDITLLHLPEPRFLPWLWRLLGSHYNYTRYQFVHRSLLSATLSVQRPLTEDEAQAVSYWSAKERNRIEWTDTCYIFAITMFGLGPMHMVRMSMSKTPFLKNCQLWRPKYPIARYTKKRAIEDVRSTFFLVGLTIIPWAYSMATWRQKEKNDPRLKALRAVYLEEKPKSWSEKYSLWASGYRAAMVPQRLSGCPNIRKMRSDSDQDKWRKLKYEAATFVNWPPEAGAMQADSELWRNE